MHSSIITKIDTTHYIPRGAPSKIQYFFILKKFDRRFLFSRSLACPVGQVCFGVACAHCAIFPGCLRYCLVFLLLLAFIVPCVFVRCKSYSFWCFNHQISDAIFFAYLVVAFYKACCDIRRAHCFVCLFAYFFAFYY